MKKNLIIMCIGYPTIIDCENQKEKKYIKDYFNWQLYQSENLWLQIRKKKIDSSLPLSLKSSKVQARLVVCRENNNNPLADHIAGKNLSGSQSSHVRPASQKELKEGMTFVFEGFHA